MPSVIKNVINSVSNAFSQNGKSHLTCIQKESLDDVIEGLFDELAGDYNALLSVQALNSSTNVFITAPTFTQAYGVMYNEDSQLIISAVIADGESATQAHIDGLKESISQVGNAKIEFYTNDKDDIIASIQSPLNLNMSMGERSNVDNLDSIYQLISLIIDERYF